MIPTLQSICQAEIIKVLEHREFDGRLVNDLCKYVPDFLLEPIFTVLSQKGVVTDTALLAFLVPSRISLFIHQARSIRNSTFKQIGLNCPNLVTLDLSNCSQVGNSVVRAILQGCPLLESMFLDRCHRITDSAFDVSESPFQFLLGCLSLQAISLQGCPQITGEIITTLNKNCRRLNYLNLSQCKNVKSPKIQHIFEHNELLSLNLGYIENISDEAFLLLPSLLSPGTGMHTSRSSSSIGITATSPLQKLNLCKSTITDRSIFKMSSLIALLEIRLQWCTGITDRGITALVQYCPLLQLIDLKSCNISDNGLQSIAEQCYELRELDLSWCINFTEIGLLQLIPLFHSDKDNKTHNLSNLNLEWCMQITDQSLYQLNHIKTLKNIKLTGCVGVSKVGIDWLKNTGRNIIS